MRGRQPWTMPEDDARGLVELIREKVGDAGLDHRHRDALLRLGAILEADLEALEADRRDVGEDGRQVEQKAA